MRGIHGGREHLRDSRKEKEGSKRNEQKEEKKLVISILEVQVHEQKLTISETIISFPSNYKNHRFWLARDASKTVFISQPFTYDWTCS